MVQWTAEKDQIILKGIFKFHDIKNSAPLLEYLAQEIGENCTAKAVSHRLNNIRNSGKPTNAPGKANSATASPMKPATPKTPRGPKTPVRKAGGTAKARAKRQASVSSTGSEGGPEGLLNSDAERRSPSRGRKRVRDAPVMNYAEPETDPEDAAGGPVKKVKTEPAEEDAGFHTAAEENEVEV